MSDNVREVDAVDSCGNSRAYSIDRVKRECEPEVVAADAWLRDAEEKAAKERQGTRTDIVAMLPQGDAGRTRDRIGEMVGIGGRVGNFAPPRKSAKLRN